MMSFHQDILDLKDRLSEFTSMEHLRENLLEKNLRLVTTFYSTGFSCLEIDITQKKMSGVLNLGMRVKISRLIGEEALIKTLTLVPVRLDEIDWIDQKVLFEKLKEGIKDCLMKVE